MAAVLIFAFAGWRDAANDARTANLRAQVAAERATGAARVVRERRRQVTSKAAYRAATALSEAKAGHPTWADAPVPQEVQDALGQP